MLAAYPSYELHTGQKERLDTRYYGIRLDEERKIYDSMSNDDTTRAVSAFA
jgi:hypothetical protein